MKVTRDDVTAFVNRDWLRARRAKELYWTSQSAYLLQMAEGLRRRAQALLPNWPTERDREEDLEAHRRLAEKLARVPKISGR